MILTAAGSSLYDAASVLILVDRLTRGTEPVTPQERYQQNLARFADEPEVQAIIRRDYERCMALYRELLALEPAIMVPAKREDFSFGHSPITTGCAQVRLFIGLSAMHGITGSQVSYLVRRFFVTIPLCSHPALPCQGGC